MVEVMIDSREFRIRSSFVGKKKQDKSTFCRVHIANSVTLATRVRLAILRAIARQYSGSKEDLFVSAYISRSVIHVKEKPSNRSYALTLTDAIEKYGRNLKQEDYAVVGKVL